MREIVVLGAGAIGGPIASELRAGAIPGAELAGVITTSGGVDSAGSAISPDHLVEQADQVVEVAGQEALRQWGVAALNAGAELLAASVGALADPDLRRSLLAAGRGRVRFVSGAIGGLDLLRAACRHGGITAVHLTTTKSAKSFGAVITEPTVMLEGSAADAARAHPRVLNVAAALALAIGDWDAVQVRLVADPNQQMTRHLIEAEGSTGRYRFDIVNHPSAANPMTSAVTVQSVMRALETPTDAWVLT